MRDSCVNQDMSEHSFPAIPPIYGPWHHFTLIELLLICEKLDWTCASRAVDERLLLSGEMTCDCCYLSHVSACLSKIVMSPVFANLDISFQILTAHWSSCEQRVCFSLSHMSQCRWTHLGSNSLEPIIFHSSLTCVFGLYNGHFLLPSRYMHSFSPFFLPKNTCFSLTVSKWWVLKAFKEEAGVQMHRDCHALP